MKDRVRAHERRLRATFQRLLLLTIAPAASLAACGDDIVVGAGGADGGGDATSASDAPAPSSDAADADVADATVPDADASRDARAFDALEARAPTDASAADGEDAETADADEDALADGPSPWCADASTGAPWWPDASGNCKYFVDLSCAQYVPVGQCLLGSSDCLKLCTLNTPLFDCEYAQPACTIAGRFVAEAGQPVTVQCDVCAGAGRRPEGLHPPGRQRARDAVGGYFARACHLEAASVRAFERLERELRAHGAPEHLTKAARRSARDEVRHARAMRRLALRHGAATETPRIRPSGNRSLEHVARENAVEGCVRETYGALLATWQSVHASDAEVRRCFARIAVDETRHAALAWAISEWADQRLDDAARKRLAIAKRRAARRLANALDGEPPADVVHLAGVPSARQARALFAGLSAEVPPQSLRAPFWIHVAMRSRSAGQKA